MMPVKLSFKGWVFMHSRLAEARRGLTFVILAMTVFPGSGVLIRASPRSTSTTGFCMGQQLRACHTRPCGSEQGQGYSSLSGHLCHEDMHTLLPLAVSGAKLLGMPAAEA